MVGYAYKITCLHGTDMRKNEVGDSTAVSTFSVTFASSARPHCEPYGNYRLEAVENYPNSKSEFLGACNNDFVIMFSILSQICSSLEQGVSANF